MQTTDFLIIGGGVMGVSIALELNSRHPDAKITLIEKEEDFGLHGSGRNSGVLHAGFYYTADSLKARFTRDGNFMMQQYCQDKGLSMNRNGKLVVCRNETELTGLKKLEKRGQNNGVELQWISRQDAEEIEPRVKTHEAALWSPSTATIDPVEVMHSLVRDAKTCGLTFLANTAYKRRTAANTVLTSQGEIEAGYVVNAAGLFADRIARDYGFSQSYRILPFKGLYLYSSNQHYRPKVHIYPVPNLDHPFLGVHFTLNIKGDIKLGPTAIPAFWRENYGGFENFAPRDTLEIISREARMWLGNKFGFRKLAWQEMQKYRKSFMIKEAGEMLHGVEDMAFDSWGKPGIRAQLVDIKQNKLEMDFIYEGDDKSFHLLNAVSPAFTCALSLSKHLVDAIENKGSLAKTG